jgi:chemotaxis methyl-accepting protein methylase
MDFDPDLAKYGSQFHICDNLLNIDKYNLGKFDFVFMNGVIGYGLNQEAEIERAFELLSQHMEPGAKMYLGTNPHLTSEKQIENISSLNANFSKLEMIRFKQPYIKNIFHEFRSYQRKEVLC